MEIVQKTEQKRYWWRDEAQQENSCAISCGPGHACPQCQEGTLAYDGLFMLTCPVCGYVAESGAFT